MTRAELIAWLRQHLCDNKGCDRCTHRRAAADMLEADEDQLAEPLAYCEKAAVVERARIREALLKALDELPEADYWNGTYYASDIDRMIERVCGAPDVGREGRG